MCASVYNEVFSKMDKKEAAKGDEQIEVKIGHEKPIGCFTNVAQVAAEIWRYVGKGADRFGD